MTLLGKKANAPAVGDLATVIHLTPEEKVSEVAFQVRDGLGVIQLHENGKN